jgi:hypothetical protein
MVNLPPGNGGRTCNATWIITAQGAGAGAGTFSGTYQSSPGNASECADSGTLDGTVTPTGDIRTRYHSSSPGGCTLTGGSTEYQGFVSAIAVTAHREYVERYPYPVLGLVDYRVTGTVSVNRR